MAITIHAEAPQPLYVQKTKLPDGAMQIVHTYRFAVDEDTTEGVPHSFDEEGRRYTREDLTVTEIIYEDVKEVSVKKDYDHSIFRRLHEFVTSAQ